MGHILMSSVRRGSEPIRSPKHTTSVVASGDGGLGNRRRAMSGDEAGESPPCPLEQRRCISATCSHAGRRTRRPQGSSASAVGSSEVGVLLTHESLRSYFANSLKMALALAAWLPFSS